MSNQSISSKINILFSKDFSIFSILKQRTSSLALLTSVIVPTALMPSQNNFDFIQQVIDVLGLGRDTDR
jgi:hypothetical protein